MAKFQDDSVGELAGGWAVTEIAYAELPPEAEITMFFADSKLAGLAACNTYSMDIDVVDGEIGLGLLERDHQECDSDLMQAEIDFLRVLERSHRFEIAQDGTLTLFAANFVMLKARRLTK